MDTNPYFLPAYKDTQSFTETDIPTTHATGFGTGPDDLTERGIDLNEQLIRNKPATFFMRVHSDAMIGAGIHNGDVVIVDRSIKPVNGKVVIAALNGEMLIRYYEVTNKRQRLLPATRKLAPIEIDPFAQFEVWGVVTYVIHSV